MDVEAYLSEKSRVIEEAIYTEVPEEPAYIYGMLREFISRGGKRIRPILTLASSDAFGGRESEALPYALSIELFHNFTLIHDDIEDASPLRRGKPTLHTQFGTPIAINSGDALYTTVWSSLLSKEIPPERFVQALTKLIRGYTLVVEGQGTELEWYRSGKFDVSEDDYFRMALGKTGALIGVSCEIGAYAAGASEKDCLAMREFGEKIGLAFQIKDDALNLTADPLKYRKQIGEDIHEGKRSLIIINMLSKAGEKEKMRAIKILGKKKKSEKEVQEVILLAKKSGAVDYALSVSARLVVEAKSALSIVRDPKKRELLETLSDYMVSREK